METNLLLLNRVQKLQLQKKLEGDLKVIKEHLDDIDIFQPNNKYQLVGRELDIMNMMIMKYNKGFKIIDLVTLNFIYETECREIMNRLIKKDLIIELPELKFAIKLNRLKVEV